MSYDVIKFFQKNPLWGSSFMELKVLVYASFANYSHSLKASCQTWWPWKLTSCRKDREMSGSWDKKKYNLGLVLLEKSHDEMRKYRTGDILVDLRACTWKFAEWTLLLLSFCLKLEKIIEAFCEICRSLIDHFVNDASPTGKTISYIFDGPRITSLNIASFYL